MKTALLHLSRPKRPPFEGTFLLSLSAIPTHRGFGSYPGHLVNRPNRFARFSVPKPPTEIADTDGSWRGCGAESLRPVPRPQRPTTHPQIMSLYKTGGLAKSLNCFLHV